MCAQLGLSTLDLGEHQRKWTEIIRAFEAGRTIYDYDVGTISPSDRRYSAYVSAIVGASDADKLRLVRSQSALLKLRLIATRLPGRSAGTFKPQLMLRGILSRSVRGRPQQQKLERFATS